MSIEVLKCINEEQHGRSLARFGRGDATAIKRRSTTNYEDGDAVSPRETASAMLPDNRERQ